MVSRNYFQTLGIPLAVGGAFTPEEDSVPGAYPVAVIGYGLWMRQFGGDPRVIGRGLELNGRAYTIAGVAPRGFQGLDTLLAGEAWVPGLPLPVRRAPPWSSCKWRYRSSPSSAPGSSCAA